MPSPDDIVVLTTAPPLRAQEIVEGLEALGIAARLHDVRGMEVESTGISRVYVFRRDLADAAAALPAIGRDVIAEPVHECPACGHEIGGEPVERCPECGLALPVAGRADPIGHFGVAAGVRERGGTLVVWFLVILGVAIVATVVVMNLI